MSENAPSIPDHQLLRVIGRGSYGEVWLARSVMGTLRAVKIVRRSSFDTERPFLREFEGIRKCEPVSRSHEGLIDVLHVGQSEADGFFYYVMELADAVEGRAEATETYRPLTLAARFNNEEPLPVEDCLHLAQSLAGALAQLHDHGLLHRDVKPSNILYVDGIPKLGDIGLVAEAGESRSFVGTEGYVPPEGPGSVKADLFALGKVLYQMLTGLDRTRYPELPDDWSELLDFDQRLELNEIVLRACEDDPERRYRNARELLAEASLVASGKSLKRLRSQERRLRMARLTGGLATGLACVALGGMFFSRRETNGERSLRLRAEAAEQAAMESRWEAQLALAQAARQNLTPGARTAALQSAAEAAKFRSTSALRSQVAFLLGKSDLIPQALPTVVTTWDQDVLRLDLEQRRVLRFPYAGDLPSARRQGVVSWWGLDGQQGAVMPATFTRQHSWTWVVSPNGDRLVDVGDGGRVWDLHQGKQLGVLPSVVVQGWPQLTTTGEIIMARPPSDLLWCDGASGKVLRSLTIADWSAQEISASPAGDLVVLKKSSDSFVCIEAESGRQRWSAAFPGYPWPPVWSPDGSRLALRQDGFTWILSAADGTKRRLDTGRDREGDTMGFLGSRHRLALSSWGAVTNIFDASLECPLFRIPSGGHTFAFSEKQGLFGLHGWKSGAKLFAWKPSPVLHTLRSEPRSMVGGYFTLDKRWFATVDRTGLQWWRLDPFDEEGPELKQPLTEGMLPLFDRPSSRCAVLADGAWKEITTSATGALAFDAAIAPQEDFTSVNQAAGASLGGSYHVGRASQSADGRLRAMAVAGKVTLWREGKLLPELSSNLVCDVVTLSADGQLLATRRLGEAPAMLVWRMTSEDTAIELIHEEPGAGVWPTFSADGHWLAIGGVAENLLLDTTTWKAAGRWPRVSSGSYGVCAFTPDGNFLITQETTSDLTFRRIGTWEIEMKLQSPLEEQLSFPVISPDGRWLAAMGGRSEFYLWDLPALRAELGERAL